MTERDLFLAALEIEDPAERSAFVKRAAGSDDALHGRVLELFRVHDEPGAFMYRPALGETLGQPSSTEGPGAEIGPYKLLEQIGEGGFGVVYMAEQTSPVRRRVALKVLKPGMDSKQVVARFEAERQALACMDHPNIARVIDGGAIPSGRPFFVMELVRGDPITDYCDQNRLGVRERLGLFVQVCRAVQHAHQKGIIHRDLKPSNVLVTVHDTVPVVKVIDFGVAKAVGQVLTDKTLFTAFAQMVGTPLYMSPEQAGQSGLDADTRTDIYSLGVLLYELLTGTTPFETERFRRASIEEIRRIIREEDPPRPSTRLSGSGGQLSARRNTEPAKLAQLVRGELDWIVMKALEKDRNRRYESASAFAADVQRYRDDEPVLACPPSPAYRLRKFARRNQAALILVGVILVAVVVLAVGGVAAALLYRGKSEEATRNATEATTNLARSRSSEERALAGEQKALASERRALANEARALLGSGRAGQRAATLRALERAAGLDPTPAERAELRDLVLAALAQPDLELDAEHPTRPPGSTGLAFDARYERYARTSADGAISVHRASDDAELLSLPGKPAAATRPEFDPSGHYLAVGNPASARGGTVRVWNLRSGAVAFGPVATPYLSWAFSPRGDRFVWVAQDGGVTSMAIVALPEGREVARVALGPSVTVGAIAFRPEGGSIAYVSRDLSRSVIPSIPANWVLSEIDVSRPVPKSLNQVESQGEIRAFAWHPTDDQSLAWVASDRGVNVSWGGAVTRLSGHAGQPDQVGFTGDGRYVVSAAPGDGVYVWDPARGQPVVFLPHEGSIHLRAAGDILGALRGGAGTRICRLAAGPDVRTFTPPGWAPAGPRWRGAASELGSTPDGRLLAVGRVNEVALWDVSSGRAVGRVPMGTGDAPAPDLDEFRVRRVAREQLSVAVSPDGKWLAYGCPAYGVHVRPIRATADGYRLGPSTQWSSPDSKFGRFPQVLLCGAGPTLAGADSRQPDRLVLLDLVSNGRRELIGRGPLGRAVVTADGTRAAACSAGGRGARVWDMTTGEVLADLDDGGASIDFSPDGRRLATGSPTEYRVYDTKSWGLLHRLTRARTLGRSPLGFSGEGRVLAVVTSSGEVGLYDVDGMQRLTMLPVSRHDPVSGLLFARDGSWLAVGTESGLVHLWDLRRARDRLRAFGLDWDPSLLPAAGVRLPLSATVIE